EPSLALERDTFWGREARDNKDVCLLPRAAVVDAASHTLLVACYGIDTVIGYDAASGDPASSEKRRWSVGSGPSGIANDPEKRLAVAWSTFDRTLSVTHLGRSELYDEKAQPPPAVGKIALAPLATPLSAEYALGRIIFHSTSDARISKDGRACASCHPDG